MKNDSTPKTPANPFGDISQILKQFELPGIDMGKIVEARKKDIEALVAANKTAYQAMQDFGDKQTEMLKETMLNIQQAAASAGKGMAANDTAKQSELVRKACEKALSDMKELAEIATKSQSEAMTHIKKRAAEQVEEIKQLMQRK